MVVGVVGAGAGVGAGVVVDDELLVGVWVEPLDVSVGAVGAGVVLAGAGALVLPPSVVPDDEELELVGVGDVAFGVVAGVSVVGVGVVALGGGVVVVLDDEELELVGVGVVVVGVVVGVLEVGAGGGVGSITGGVVVLLLGGGVVAAAASGATSAVAPTLVGCTV